MSKVTMRLEGFPKRLWPELSTALDEAGIEHLVDSTTLECVVACPVERSDEPGAIVVRILEENQDEQGIAEAA